MTDFTVVIPARYASTRFPGKPLALIDGKPMLQCVYERAVEAGASKIVVATDDIRIQDVAQGFGADVCMTSNEHVSGTARIAEVIATRNIGSNEIVINVQGDEPFIPPENIRQVANNLKQFSSFPMATLCYPINEDKDVFNPNVVKVVKSPAGKAIYFSRAPIPFARGLMQVDHEGRLCLSEQASQAKNSLTSKSDTAAISTAKTTAYFRHIGIYGYRADFVTLFNQMESSTLERYESLEQLRVLENGHEIHIEVASKAPPHGVDTPDDLIKLSDSQRD